MGEEEVGEVAIGDGAVQLARLGQQRLERQLEERTVGCDQEGALAGEDRGRRRQELAVEPIGAVEVILP